MRKTLLLLIFLSGATSLNYVNAQPTINSAYAPAISNRYFYKIADTSANPGPAGAGINWNFGTLPSSLSTIEHRWVNPSSTPYGASFPGSNLANENLNVSSGVSYEYYESNANLIKKKGVATATSQSNFGGGYKFYSYPLSFGQTVTDNISGSDGIANITGTITISYDGYGNLQLPATSGGTYNNVGRIKQVESMVKNYGPGIDIYTIITTYWWMDNTTNNGKKQPIFFITTTEDSGLATGYYKFVGIREILVGTEELKNETSFQLSPNPASEYFTVSVNNNFNGSDLELEMVDVTGRIVRYEKISNANSDSIQKTFQVGDLKSGIYFIRLRSELGVSASKLAIE